MKKIILPILLCSVFSTYGQSNQANNKEVVRKVFLEVWNKKDFSELDRLWSDSVTFHINNNKFTISPIYLTNLVEKWHDAFPDLKFEIHHIVVEDNIVAINVNYTGTHSKTFKGIEPLNNYINVSQMMFFKLKDEQIVEAWELYDLIGMQRQMKGEN